ncbi:hypothetical protein BC567DRAFT_225861 [Phyllosticta citribraziliensis]
MRRGGERRAATLVPPTLDKPAGYHTAMRLWSEPGLKGVSPIRPLTVAANSFFEIDVHSHGAATSPHACWQRTWRCHASLWWRLRALQATS